MVACYTLDHAKMYESTNILSSFSTIQGAIIGPDTIYIWILKGGPDAWRAQHRARYST